MLKVFHCISNKRHSGFSRKAGLVCDDTKCFPCLCMCFQNVVESIYLELMGRSHVLECCLDLEPAVKETRLFFVANLLLMYNIRIFDAPIIFSISLNARGLAPMD